MGLILRAFELVGDAIDRVGRGREDLYGSLQHAVRRASELAVANAGLQDRIDELERMNSEQYDAIGRLRFNGPDLHDDEGAALEQVVADLVLNNNYALGNRPDKQRQIDAIRGLLERSYRLPATQPPRTVRELMERAKAAGHDSLGIANDPEWPAAGEPDIINWPVAYEHSNPPEGFLPCTRRWGHEGPCAHPPVEASYCGCTGKFRTAEDWRDHMNPSGPCDGVPYRCNVPMCGESGICDGCRRRGAR